MYSVVGHTVRRAGTYAAKVSLQDLRVVLTPSCYVLSAPKLKGRPRKRRKGKEPADPNSPEGSDSNGSENSMAVAGKVRSAQRGR
jgi:hypothetical protein